MKAVVFTLGCKVNDCESASLSAGLEEMGYEVSAELGYADLYILNTCAVTKEAEAKSRQLVARVRRYNPDAPVVVCGCAAEKDADAFLKKGVRLVTGAKRKDLVLSALSDCGCEISADDKTFERLPDPKQFRTRAYVKVQDGCNHFCSYCIIPYLRGRTRSKSFAECVREILSCPSEEIVLTGIDLSSYRDGERGLAALTEAIADSPARIRFGSLEVGVVDEAFLKACQKVRNFAPQFHLSLQSGSSEVLRAMNRHYTREDYLARCAMIRSAFPNAAITTDLIAGFPTETEKHFEESLSIISEAGFSQVHCFAYSPREGTNAAKLKDLPAEVKRERLHRLLCEAEAAKQRYLRAQLGRTLTLLCEEREGGDTVGYTENYVRAYLAGDASGMVRVRAESLYEGGVRAVRIE